MIVVQSPSQINRRLHHSPPAAVKRKHHEDDETADHHGSFTAVGSSVKKPCYHRGTIYEKMLSPLTPSLTLPVPVTRRPAPAASTDIHSRQHNRALNQALEKRLASILVDEAADDEKQLKDFLLENWDKIDINGYGEDGVTPLQRVCQSGGKVGLARTLVGYGADVRMTSRDGWSAVHMASFSGNTSLMMFLLSCRV